MGNLYRLLSLITISLCHQLCYSQEVFSPTELIADINSLNQKIIEIHPNPFFSIDSVSYFKEMKAIKEGIKTPLSADAFHKLIAPIISKIGDGHTGLLPDQSLMNISKLRFPFDVFIEDGKIFITENYSTDKKIPLGGEILKINDIPTNEILFTLLKYSPGELFDYKMTVIESLFPMVYKSIYGEFDEFFIEIQSSNTIQNYKIDKLENISPKTPEFMKPSKLYFDDDIAVIDLRNFSSSDFIPFINSAFTEIAEKKCESLIIDLRNNGGGHSMLADSLISYLTDKEYQSMISDSIKISSVTTQYIEQLQKMSLGQKNGSIYTWDGMPVHPIKRAHRYNGALYILTSPMTYSTAGFFANVVKCYKLGTVIGSETGQPLIAYGDPHIHTLPNTKLLSRISKQKFIFCCAQKSDIGVIPDYEIGRNLKDILEGKDTVMEFTLSLINTL